VDSLLSRVVAAPDPYHQSADLVIAHRNRVCIAICRGDLTVDVVQRTREGVLALAKAHSGGIGYLFVVPEISGIPAGPVRDAVGQMFDAVRPHLRVVSGHIDGSGFRASAKRSVFTFATSRILGGTQVKAHGSLVDATTWLEAKCKDAGLACPAGRDLQALVTKLAAA
jgi:hypothetical protein